jgi:hypothetical protein
MQTLLRSNWLDLKILEELKEKEVQVAMLFRNNDATTDTGAQASQDDNEHEEKEPIEDSKQPLLVNTLLVERIIQCNHDSDELEEY